jgi:4-methylaminobutanoate oxidase (formaldehyde-forming)
MPSQPTLPKEADVVVVGAGILGCSAAFHLAEAGCKRIVLLDRGPIANGTTPFAAGQTGHVPADRAMVGFVNYCVEFLENFEKHTGITIDFRRSGSVRIAMTEPSVADLEARLEGAKATGQPAELISPFRAKEMAPLLNLEKACGILYLPRDGYVEPKSVAVAFATAAHNRGVLVSTHTTVSSLDISAGEIRGVRTSRGMIRTGRIVVAAGAWTRLIGMQSGVNIKVVPVRHQAFVTAPITGVKLRQPIVRVIEPQIYVREEAGGLLVGGYGYRPTSFDMSEFPEHFEMAALEADQIYYSELREAASEYFPVLRDALIIQERRGLPTMSADARLVVSESDDIKGLIIASACGVGGVFQSPGVGRAVADLVTGRPSSLPLDVLRDGRFAGSYDDDSALRAQCESVYARMYLPASRT